MSTVARLKGEFGSFFLLYALYSGELVGYKFDTWDHFDRHIDRWAQALKVSRSAVVCEWMSIWLELGHRYSAKEQCAAFLRARECWGTACGNLQDEPIEGNWQPAVKAGFGPSNTKFGVTAKMDVTR